MINKLVLESFARNVAEKQASVGAALLGAGVLGGGLLAANLGGNVARDMSYGRAERLEEKARRMKAIAAAKSMPRYNAAVGGMH